MGALIGMILVFGLVIGAVILLDVLASRYGVDSRDGFDMDPRKPVSGIVA